MSQYRAVVEWEMEGPDFVRGQFSRVHQWRFDGGITLKASASPQVVPAPWSSDAGVDPEEAFVAALASCHMLTFLWVASRAKRRVLAYSDTAVGSMIKNEAGVPWVNEVVLSPQITWHPDDAPDAPTLAHLHEQAHHYCFIANSVKTEVRVAPVG